MRIPESVAQMRAFVFHPTDPIQLGVSRFLFFSLVLSFFGGRTLWGVYAEEMSAFWQPIFLFENLNIRPPSTDALRISVFAWKVSLFFATIGIFTRTSTALTAILGLYIFGAGNSFGRIENATSLVVGTMVLIAFFRSGDAFSVDSWFISHQKTKERLEMGTYRWPLVFVRAYMTWAYFTAGVAKVRVSGWDWVVTDNLSSIFLSTGTPLGEFLSRFSLLCSLLAAVVLIMELLSPLALFSSVFRKFWLVFIVLFHLSIALVFRNERDFIAFLFPLVFWFDWALLLKRLPNRIRSRVMD